MPYQKESLLPRKSSRESLQMRRVWEQFLAGRGEGLEGLRPIVRESWLRCRERGVDPGLKAAPIVFSQEQVQNLRRENVLCEAAAPVLRFLCTVLEGHRFLVMLADSQNRPLEIVGHPKALDGAEQINVVFGSQWAEDQVGTDALAVSSLLDTPVQIHWSEHYCEIGHGWAGNAAPIHHPFTQEVMGTLNIYGYNEIAHPRALELVTDAAVMVEQQLYEKELSQRLLLFEHYNAHQSRFPHDIFLGMDAKGTILLASPGTVNLLGLRPQETIGCLFSRLPGVSVQEPFLKPDGDGRPYDLHLHTKACGSLKATLFPVTKERSLAGLVAILPAKSPPAKHRQADSSWRASYTFADIVGESARLSACIAEARKIAGQDLPVLISGESGTGKELFAHSIHSASERREGPLVPLNCGGMSEELLSTELFGYAEGAFTGAVRGGRRGKLELAHGGTLFLDEVEEMSPKMQVHLLRVLEEGRVVRIGAEKPSPIHVRVIAATNADLEARIRDGRFRPDLYYRLSVLTLSLPSLRERSTDIPLLVQHLLSSQRNTTEVSKEALEGLKAYPWPGNVRQLKNVLLQAADRAVGGMVTATDLPAPICSAVFRSNIPPSPAEEQVVERKATALQTAEREIILQALKDYNGNISQAASRLGLHRVTLYRKMKRHAIEPQRVWR